MVAVVVSVTDKISHPFPMLPNYSMEKTVELTDF